MTIEKSMLSIYELCSMKLDDLRHCNYISDDNSLIFQFCQPLQLRGLLCYLTPDIRKSFYQKILQANLTI